MSEIPFPFGMFIYVGETRLGSIPVFTLFFALAFALALFWIRHACLQAALFLQDAQNALLLALFFGILGAKIFFAIEVWDRIWQTKDPLATKLHYIFLYKEGLRALHPNRPELLGFYETVLSGGGLVFFGGALFAGLSVFLYYKISKKNIVHYLGIFAVAGALAYGSGRLGCSVSGDGCFGARAPLHLPPLSVVYGPPDGRCNTDPAMAWKEPIFCSYGLVLWNTSLVEALLSFAFALYWMRRLSADFLAIQRERGLKDRIFSRLSQRIFLYWVLQNASTRFFIEFVRLNDAVFALLPPPSIRDVETGESLPLIHPTRLAFAQSGLSLKDFYANWHWYGPTEAQLLSLGLIAIAGFFLYRTKNPK